MKTTKICFMVLLTFLLVPALALADADSFILNAMTLCIYTSDYGNPVDTWEDVSPITNIRIEPGQLKPTLTEPMLNAFKQPQKDITGKAILKKINDTNGRIVYNPGIEKFLKHFLILESGACDPDSVTSIPSGNSRKLYNDFTDSVTYDDTAQPHQIEFFVGIKPKWSYIASFTAEPDDYSCNHSMRSYCEECFGCEFDETIVDPVTGSTVLRDAHKRSYKNVYKKLYDQLDAHREKNGPGFNKDATKLKVFEMIFKDRTPPIIQNSIGNELPEIGKSKPSTTGDFFKTTGLKIKDNKSSQIGVCMALAVIDGFPSGANWRNASEWDLEDKIRVIPNDSQAQYIILPNTCHGAMEYGLLTWDTQGNMNPSDPHIHEDDPEHCYGLHPTPFAISDIPDLGTDPNSAIGWPTEYKLNLAKDNDPGTADMNVLKATRIHNRGLIHIRDNDLPNLVIKIKSVKDESKVFFPPIIEPSALAIYASGDYGPVEDNVNLKDYTKFIEDIDDNVFTSSIVNGSKSIYFKVLEAKASPVMASTESNCLTKFVYPVTDQDFLFKNFRLENYEESDTDKNGVAINNGTLFGERYGFGGSVIAVLDQPLQEDVEYIISVWADDNVKWATIDESGQLLDEIISIPTGINDARGKVEIRNQYPEKVYNIEFDKTKAVTKELKVVFREPTKPLPTKGSADELLKFCIANRLPSIEVWVEDFAKLRRSIKLYVTVSDENPNIRVIERQHEKR